MYSFLVFAHVISALLLGSFMVFPFAFRFLLPHSGDGLKSAAKIWISFTRFGQYALVLLIITGVWMVMGYGTHPSMLWVLLSLVLLTLIGALLGMMQAGLKRIIRSADPTGMLEGFKTKMNTLGWLTFSLVFIVIFIMTNRGLFV